MEQQSSGYGRKVTDTMMVSFDFLTNPINLSNDKINVLCMENTPLFRNTLSHFYDGCPEESNIVFSEDYIPVRFKNKVAFIPDFFTLDFSSVFIRKIQEDVSAYANQFLQEETLFLKSETEKYLEKVAGNYDFDFIYKDNFEIADLLKMQEFKPALSTGNLLFSLLDFILLTKKYSTVTCFVLLQLHHLFEQSELEVFYKELIDQKIAVLVLENRQPFQPSIYEKITILDKDLCEIVEK